MQSWIFLDGKGYNQNKEKKSTGGRVMQSSLYTMSKKMSKQKSSIKASWRLALKGGELASL